MHTIKLTKVNHRSIHTSKPKNKGVQCIYTIGSKEKRSMTCVKDRFSYNFISFEKPLFFLNAHKSRSLGFFIHICKLLRLVGCDARINDLLNISV